MKIAILGATSEIAKDLVRSFLSEQKHECVLFSRRPERMKVWQAEQRFLNPYPTEDFHAFAASQKFDALINFVGVGNPAAAASMGASILEVTAFYDEMALAYLREHPGCQYVFLSSGAAYGENFEQPVTSDSYASFPMGNRPVVNWYSIAKFYAEMRHRAMSEFSIIDLRVFNYVSRYQDVNAKFLITDMVRAIISSELFKTNSTNIVRDYLCPRDFALMVAAALGAGGVNTAMDCFTKGPTDKYSLLECMHGKFGLQYEIVDSASQVSLTGLKNNYYSTNHLASDYGYMPEKTSLEGIAFEIGALLAAKDSHPACQLQGDIK